MANSLAVPPVCMMMVGGAAVSILAVCMVMRLRDEWWTVGFVLMAVSIGGIWSLRERPENREKGVRRVEVVSGQSWSGNHLACDADVEGVGLIRLNTDSTLRLEVGETVESNIRIYWPRYRGGEFNYPLYLYRKGYSGVAWLEKDNIKRKGESGEWNMAVWRKSCSERYRQAGVSERNAGIVSAITVGEKNGLDEDVREGFMDAGVAHVLVVSGMHVGFIFLLINFFLLRVRRRWIVVICGTAAMWVYAIIVGLTPSVCRAALMFTIMLICILEGDDYKSINALSISAVVLMVINPLTIYDAGFQLSYMAVLSIIIFYPAIPPLRRENRVLRMLWNVVRLSVSAQMLVMPVVIYYFGQIPVYFLLTNVMISVLTPVVFVTGLLTLLPIVGEMTGGVLDVMLDVMRGTVMWVAGLPGSTIEMTIWPAAMAASLVLILMIGNILRSPIER